jgi:hypothetical protein
MAHGRRTKTLNVTPAEWEKLTMLARRPKSSQSIAMRAYIVLGCDEGTSNSVVAKKLRVTGATVFASGGSGFAYTGWKACSTNRSPALRERLPTHRLKKWSPGHGVDAGKQHALSSRLMAEKIGLSQTAIVRFWHAFGLQPHRVENFKFSKDTLFVEKVRDIVGLYMNPPDHAIVICVDERSHVQALNWTQTILLLAPGVPVRQSHDYERHGVTSLFAAMDVASGVTIGSCRRHRHREFLRFLNEIDASLLDGFDVHLVMDNYGMHKVGKVQAWLARHPATTCISRPLQTNGLSRLPFD